MRRDGSHFGTLCALDVRPAKLSEDHLNILRLIASLLAFELEAKERQERTEFELAQERDFSVTRERLLGILGHDLRTPIAAIALSAEAIAMTATNDDVQQQAVSILATARRAARMTRDLLDFTRVRLAGGIPVTRSRIDLRRVVEKIVAEARLAAPERMIAFQVTGDCEGDWDPDRIAQIVANLAWNAVEHGRAKTPVQVEMRGTAASVEIAVSNRADPIPAHELATLFSPFRSRSASDGLGLGLFIVREIARAHRGDVDVICEGDRVTFRAVLPR